MTTATSRTADSPTRIITILALASFASAANLRVCDPLLPQIAGELGVTVGTTASVVTAFAVAYGLSQIVVGPLGDARGKLSMVVAGSVWAGVGTILFSAMPDLWLLTLFRFLSGAGAAAVIPLAIAWIGDVIPYERRQPVLARFLSGQILGVVFGQVAGGVLGEMLGWRWTMVVLGLLHIAAALLLFVEMRRSKLSFPLVGKARWRHSAVSAVRVLQLPWVRVVLLTVFFEGLAMFGALAYVGADLHHRFGLSLSAIGGMLAAFGAGAFVYVAAAEILVRKLGQSGLAAIGAVLMAAAFVALALTPTPWIAPPAVAVLGLGFYMFHNTLQTNATQMAPEARGLAVSLFAFTLFTSQSIGVALAAPVMDRYGGSPIFLAAALILVAAAFWFRRQLLLRPAA